MPSDQSLNHLLEKALVNLHDAIEEAAKLRTGGDKDFYRIRALFQATILIHQFQEPIFEKHPELRPPPPWINEPEPCLTDEQKISVAKLSTQTLKEIDAVLLSYAKNYFQKVAKIVGIFMMESDLRQPEIPDLFYAQRIEKLVSDGLLEHEGNLKFMGYCEVRIPTK